MTRGRAAVATLAAAGALAAAAVAAWRPGTDRDTPTHPAAVTVTVNPGAHGPTVPRSFLGVSIEWDSVLPYTGPARHRRAGLLRVLAPVARAARAPLALRIGGDTADQAWWNPSARRPRPRTVLQDIGPATLDAIGWLARGLGGPVTLGLNLALRDPGNARTLARAAARRLPPGALRALEVGNEPDLYTHGRTFVRGGHVHRRLTKDPHYSVAAYARDTLEYLRVLHAAGLRPAPLLVVGGFAGPGWWPGLARLLPRWRGRAGAVAAHLYALPNCAATTPPAAWLATTQASGGRVATLRPLVSIARRAGLPARLAELNSAACGGRPRFSDTRAAALWTADALFAALRLGFAEADVHTWRGALYAPFAITRNGVGARPPLAGMLAFARGAPAGSRLAAVRVRGGGSLRAWATADARGTVRVVLLAADATKATVEIVGSRRRYRARLAADDVAVLTLPPSSARR